MWRVLLCLWCLCVPSLVCAFPITLVCPYETSQEPNGRWLRTLSLYRVLPTLRLAFQDFRHVWTWEETLSELEVRGNRALVQLEWDRLSEEIQARILDPLDCACAIVEDPVPIKQVARVPRLVDGVVHFDDDDPTRLYINPEQFGLVQQTRAPARHVPSILTGLLSPRAAVAQTVTRVLDSFNRNPRRFVTARRPWGARIDTLHDSDELQLLSQAVTRGETPGESSSYWAARTFRQPEVFVEVAAEPLPTESHRLVLIYREVHTAMPSGYQAEATRLETEPRDSVSLVRLDNGIATRLGVPLLRLIAAGQEWRLAHQQGTLRVQHCKPTCFTRRTELDTTYQGLAYLGIGTNSATVFLDNFGGGSLLTTGRSEREP